MGTGGLAPPAAHRSDTVGRPVPRRTETPATGLHTADTHRSGFSRLQAQRDVKRDTSPDDIYWDIGSPHDSLGDTAK
jgi:hypothetical protein